MGSPTAPLDLTLSDPERSKSRSLRFQSLVSRKGAQLDPTVTILNINRKPYMASRIIIAFDLQWPCKVKVKVTSILSGRKAVSQQTHDFFCNVALWSLFGHVSPIRCDRVV